MKLAFDPFARKQIGHPMPIIGPHRIERKVAHGKPSWPHFFRFRRIPVPFLQEKKAHIPIEFFRGRTKTKNSGYRTLSVFLKSQISRKSQTQSGFFGVRELRIDFGGSIFGRRQAKMLHSVKPFRPSRNLKKHT